MRAEKFALVVIFILQKGYCYYCDVKLNFCPSSGVSPVDILTRVVELVHLELIASTSMPSLMDASRNLSLHPRTSEGRTAPMRGTG